MTTLISFVGDSDPIRNRHDGPLLHLARCLKPAKIILLNTERSLKKQDRVIMALNSIKNYKPKVISEQTVISNEKIFIFDQMFEVLNDIMKKYQNEEKIVLNLTSGTPQMISAMFSINRISGLNVRAFQVASPMHSSNEGIEHDNDKNLQNLITDNFDNHESFDSRLVEDKGEKFQKLLIKKTVSDFISNFDYFAAYQLSISNKITSISKQKKLNRNLNEIVRTVKYQEILPDVAALEISESEKVFLNGYLLISLQARRELTSEVLIRAKNLAEFAAEMYIKQKYPNIIKTVDDKPYLNDQNDFYEELLNYFNEGEKNKFKSDDFLSLPSYIKIINYFEKESQYFVLLKEVLKVNYLRNRVAHGFKKINKFQPAHIVEVCFKLLQMTFNIGPEWSMFFKKKNDYLLDLLK